MTPAEEALAIALDAAILHDGDEDVEDATVLDLVHRYGRQLSALIGALHRLERAGAIDTDTRLLAASHLKNALEIGTHVLTNGADDGEARLLNAEFNTTDSLQENTQ